MNRLQSELHRLYLPGPQAHGDDDPPSSTLIDPLGRVRAMVMELTRPPNWELLSRVWQGVQADLELPAPAIAVSGTDGLQLWFSLAAPVAASQAHAFLESLRARFLPEVEPGRVRLMPAPDASALRQEGQARRVPALQAQTGNWSAFVAADLAPVFADTPWIDIPPNEEGQAALLRGLASIEPEAFDEASKRLALRTHPPQATHAGADANADAVTTSADAPLTPPQPPTDAACEAAKRFLLQVMNDEAVALALRIEAAKALLQPSNDRRPRRSD